jgi:hypothetical protein
VADRGGEPYDWYELHILTLGESGEGRQFKGVAQGTLVEMVDAAKRQPHSYRIVYVGVVVDASDVGSVCPGTDGA